MLVSHADWKKNTITFRTKKYGKIIILKKVLYARGDNL